MKPGSVNVIYCQEHGTWDEDPSLQGEGETHMLKETKLIFHLCACRTQM